MKRKIVIFILLVLFTGLSLMADKSVTFLQNGNMVTDVLIDISSRTGQVEFMNNRKVHRSQVWMVNYVNARWNFPLERKQLANHRDTIFLKSGKILYVNIVDFSIRKRTYEFLGGGAVHESKVLRIYFCCTKLPAAYARSL
jgi:hypothetical protein